MVPSPSQLPQEIDSGLSCVLILARYFGLAADAEQLTHEFGGTGRPCGDTEILRVARRLRVKTGKRATTWPRC